MTRRRQTGGSFCRPWLAATAPSGSFYLDPRRQALACRPLLSTATKGCLGLSSFRVQRTGG